MDSPDQDDQPLVGSRAWTFVTTWVLPSDPLLRRGWDDARTFHTAGRALAHARVARLQPLRARWDAILEDVGGDPCCVDWECFRPLRLSREEDWSDWLAFLLEQSGSGAFAAHLLQRDAPASGGPKVERERSIDGYRLDLIIRWSTGAPTHIEVKVGDQQFEKTFGGAKALENREGTECRHWILIPREDRTAWSSVAERYASPRWPRVTAVTWRGVALALRRALRDGLDERSWRVWAWTFLGAVEQRLLGHPRGGSSREALDSAESLDAIRVLEEALT